MTPTRLENVRAAVALIAVCVDPDGDDRFETRLDEEVGRVGAAGVVEGLVAFAAGLAEEAARITDTPVDEVLHRTLLACEHAVVEEPPR